MSKLNFEVDVVDVDQGTNATVIEMAKLATKHGMLVTSFILNGPGGGNPAVKLQAGTEADAYAFLDELYGPEGDHRESNHFYVYGEQATAA